METRLAVWSKACHFLSTWHVWITEAKTKQTKENIDVILGVLLQQNGSRSGCTFQGRILQASGERFKEFSLKILFNNKEKKTYARIVPRCTHRDYCKLLDERFSEFLWNFSFWKFDENENTFPRTKSDNYLELLNEISVSCNGFMKWYSECFLALRRWWPPKATVMD